MVEDVYGIMAYELEGVEYASFLQFVEELLVDLDAKAWGYVEGGVTGLLPGVVALGHIALFSVDFPDVQHAPVEQYGGILLWRGECIGRVAVPCHASEFPFPESLAYLG